VVALKEAIEDVVVYVKREAQEVTMSLQEATMTSM